MQDEREGDMKRDDIVNYALIGLGAFLVGFAVLTLVFGCYLPPGPAPESLTVRVAWSYESTVVYAMGDVVSLPEHPGGPMYQSLRDGNQGHTPPSEIVSERDAWGAPGEQYPWIVPDPDWPAWWVRIH